MGLVLGVINFAIPTLRNVARQHLKFSELSIIYGYIGGHGINPATIVKLSKQYKWKGNQYATLPPPLSMILIGSCPKGGVLIAEG